jgi:hypothetical protein
LLLSGGLGSNDGGTGVIGGSGRGGGWSETDGPEGVVVDGASGGLTQNGEFPPSARLAASPSPAGMGWLAAGSTVLMKLSL